MQREKLNLTCHTYPDHLREVMQEMMTSDDFTDVTLVSDDKQSLRAHRNVLSACSQVFKSIFQIEAKNNHPVLYLRGIKYEEMESIIQFIYLGEAHFHEERINEFLLVAKNLEIKELYKEDGEVSSVDISADLSKEKRNFEIKNLNDEDGEKSVNLSADLTKENKILDNIKEESTETFDKLDSSLIKSVNIDDSSGSKFQCPQCAKLFTWKASVIVHMKSDHDGVRYSCNQCSYQAKTQSALTRHVKFVHEGAKFNCNQCDQQFSIHKSLTNHIQIVHEGIKLYVCNLCDKEFTEKCSLTKHNESKHEGITYACDHCDKTFSGQGNLSRHKQTQHA